MDRIVSDATAFSAGIQGNVRLIATASAIAEALLDDIAAFMRVPANRNIKIDIEERFSRDLVRQIEEGSASLGVCWDSVDLGAAPDALPARPARARGPCGHPLAERTSLAFEETLDAEHVGLPPSTSVHAMLQRAAAGGGRSISYRVIVSNSTRRCASSPPTSASASSRSRSAGAASSTSAWCRSATPGPSAASRSAFASSSRCRRASQRLVEHLLLRAAQAEPAT